MNGQLRIAATGLRTWLTAATLTFAAGISGAQQPAQSTQPDPPKQQAPASTVWPPQKAVAGLPPGASVSQRIVVVSGVKSSRYTPAEVTSGS